MYKAFLNDTCILNAALDIILENPELELADNSAGSFSFTIYHDNPGYKLVNSCLLTGVVTVYWDGEILYKGRIINVEQDFYKGLTVQTEGELAYLDDTIQRPAEYHELTVRGYLDQLIQLHNAKAGADKQFTLGAVTVTDSNDSLYRYTNWESTLDVLKDDLLDSLGGHFRVRYDTDGTRLLDYLADYPRLSNQTIEFGENLMSYTEATDATCIATVCIPLGARQEESDIEALEKRLTIESVNNGSDELKLDAAIASYGRITKTVTWDNVHTPSILMAKGQRWLQDNQYSEMTLTLTAVDLADFGVDVDHLRLLDRIRCTSAPHGMDREFPLTEMKINLLDPSQNVYTLGSKIKGFSGSTSRATKTISQELGNQPSKSHVLKQALDNATALINMYGNDGHVMITNNEIYIMDYDNIEDAQNAWRWNLGGLAYSSSGYEGPYELAITMDGTIAGRFIAAGTVGADQISVSYTSTQEKKWQDELENNYWTTVEVETAIENSADSVKIYAQETAVGTFNTKISDYYKKSEIDVTVNGINSSVTTKLGDYYTKTEVDQKDNAIVSTVNTKVGTSELGTMIEQSASHVKIAWNKISSVIQFENAQMNIYNGSNKIISFNSNGMDHYYSGYHVGNIGTGYYVNDSSKRGLAFHLKTSAAYMSWGVNDTSGDVSNMKFAYMNKTCGDWSSGKLHLGAALDCHNWEISNGTFKGHHYSSDGYQGTTLSTIKIPTAIDSTGVVQEWYTLSLHDGLICN